jgi:hypothetical protein
MVSDRMFNTQAAARYLQDSRCQQTLHEKPYHGMISDKFFVPRMKSPSDEQLVTSRQKSDGLSD